MLIVTRRPPTVTTIDTFGCGKHTFARPSETSFLPLHEGTVKASGTFLDVGENSLAVLGLSGGFWLRNPAITTTTRLLYAFLHSALD
jgi:hypothetical protein